MRLSTLLVTAIGLGIVGQPPSKDPSPAATNVEVKDEKLRQELLRRMQADQEARKPMMALMQQHQEAGPEQIKNMNLPAVKHMNKIDRDNTDRMKEIVKRFGWPGKSLVGKDGANAAWILVQHADHDRPFQKRCLGLLHPAVKNGEATGEQLAYLTDRVRIGENKKQVYGTQFRFVDGKLQPYPIEDEANVDRRRKAVGLSTLADYLKFSHWLLEQAAKPANASHPGTVGSPGVATTAAQLVLSVKRWHGEYTSKDAAGGVETTPVSGAIDSVRADGTGLKEVVSLGKNTDYPTVSPDGRWLYFQSNASGHSQVYRCRPGGTGVTNLTAGARLGPQWQDAYGYSLSRDGTKLLYTVHDGHTGQVAMANADGSQPRLIAPKVGYIYMAALSPHNHRVVCSGPARGYCLLLITLESGKVIELTPHHPDSFVPQFTPDGKTIVFIRRDGDVYRVDADGRNLRRLTVGNRHVEFRLSTHDQHGSSDAPQVSPDGRRIAFVSEKSGVANVSVMRIDGSQQRQLTSRKEPCGRVQWSPDGEQLAFVSFVGKYPQLFTVAARGGEPRQLTRLDGAVYFVAWSRPTRP